MDEGAWWATVLRVTKNLTRSDPRLLLWAHVQALVKGQGFWPLLEAKHADEEAPPAQALRELLSPGVGMLGPGGQGIRAAVAEEPSGGALQRHYFPR